MNLCRHTCTHTCAWKHKRWEIWKNLGTQYLLWRLCIFLGALCRAFIIFWATSLRMHFFVRQIFWKLRAKFRIYTNLGNIIFFSFSFFLALGFEICSNFELGGSTVWNVGSKHVEEVDNLRLEICSSLQSGGLTVWHLNPNTSRGVNLRLQICSSLRLGG